jgi:hypothetical protein
MYTADALKVSYHSSTYRFELVYRALLCRPQGVTEMLAELSLRGPGSVRTDSRLARMVKIVLPR